MAFGVLVSPPWAGAGSREKGLGKTHIGELFFKERVLRLPSPWPARIRITITERHLRLMITAKEEGKAAVEHNQRVAAVG